MLFPILFSIYSVYLSMKALNDCPDGIKINCANILTIHIADDTVLVADIDRGLQNIVKRINMTCKKINLAININKTKSIID